MSSEEKAKKYIGVLSGAAFLYIFFSMSIVKSCTGKELIDQGLKSDNWNEWFVAVLLIIVLVLVVF